MDERLDTALLSAATTLIGAASWRTTRVGGTATRSPHRHCEIVGLPRIQRYGYHHEDLE